MTREAQRVAIAEACGWAIKATDNYVSVKHELRGDAGGPANSTQAVMDCANVPDYLNSLDAMHEAEMTLTGEQYTKFHYYLVASRNNECTPRCRCVSATAAQRAKAVLQAIGKWEE